MKSTGIVRDVDKMGRVVIPKEIRKQLNIQSDVDSLEIFIEGDSIILKKHRTACFFCNRVGEMVNYKGYKVCGACVSKLKALLDENE